MGNGALGMGRQGDKETRRQGDKETRRQGGIAHCPLLIAHCPVPSP
ncbi:hypothetical protein [Tolypothrix sp. VBCCA 56010]